MYSILKFEVETAHSARLTTDVKGAQIGHLGGSEHIME